MNLIWIGSRAPENQTRSLLLLESEFFGQNIDFWPTRSSVVTMATMHLPIQIWLFLFIPPGNLPPHKNWRGVNFFISHFASLFWRIALNFIRALPRKHWACAVPFSRLPLVHDRFCYIQGCCVVGWPHKHRSGLCSAIPSTPFSLHALVYLALFFYACFASHNRVCAVLFSRPPLICTLCYIQQCSCMRTLLHKHSNFLSHARCHVI